MRVSNSTAPIRGTGWLEQLWQRCHGLAQAFGGVRSQRVAGRLRTLTWLALAAGLSTGGARGAGGELLALRRTLGPLDGHPQQTQSKQILRLEVLDASHCSVAPLELFLACSAEGWSPRGRPASRGHGPLEADGSDLGWIFELPRELVETQDLAFKFTRGSWETVEVDGSGNDLADRRLGTIAWPDDGSTARLRLEVLGFDDQRGTRFPARTKPASSFTGNGERFEFPSKRLGDRRTIRVWLPPGYAQPENRRRRYPVLYLQDGQNCFDVATSAIGQEWRVDEVLGAAIEAGQLEPWIVVAIDNIGATRAADYNPSGLDVRGSLGRGNEYLAFLCDELLPEVERRYRVARGADRRALGGSSFGGNITLLALLERPGFFGRVLIESPALWVGDGVLIERLAQHRGRLPARIFIGMGGRESGEPAKDQALVERARSLAEALGAVEDDPAAPRRLWIEAEGNHNESTWARRLPQSLALVLGPTLSPAAPPKLKD